MTYDVNLYRAQIVMPVKSGLVRDEIVNDFHWSHAGAPADADFDNLTTAISHFYNSTATGASTSLSSYMGDVFSTTTNAVAVKYYELPTDGSAAGPPKAIKHFTLTSVGGNTLPEECAICLTFEGDQTGISEFSANTRPRSRRRNRIYVGPLANTSYYQDSTTKRTYTTVALRTILTKAAPQYLYTEAFSHSWNWMVVSRTAVENHPVFFVACDDTMDTQRRRGPEVTSKTWVSVV